MSAPPTALEEARALLRRPAARIAVVGASNDSGKYGNIITRNLKQRGYQVLPVNPHETTIAGLRVHKTLAEIAEPVDIVDVVTPPDVTIQILRDAASAGMKLVWLQPGSYDTAVLTAAAAAPFQTVHGGACIMVEARDVALSRT